MGSVSDFVVYYVYCLVLVCRYKDKQIYYCFLYCLEVDYLLSVQSMICIVM